MTLFADARKVADAVLYEGYALYPYRASSAKNRVRFQWGVLVPDAYRSVDPSERSHNQTECIIEGPQGALMLKVRFLHLAERRLRRLVDGAWMEVDSLDLGEEILQTWDDAHEMELDIEVDRKSATQSPVWQRFELPGDESEETLSTGSAEGRVTRTRLPLVVDVRTSAIPIESPYGIQRIRVNVFNRSDPGATPQNRDQALRSSLVGCHVLMALDSGAFISQMAPPEWAKPHVAECVNEGAYPVLIGDGTRQETMLSSPIILYDNPEIAPESPGDLFDALEIDEILTLRTMTLTDDEKRQAKGTDPRVASLIDQVDFLPPEMLERLHGAIRSLEPLQRKEPSDELEHPSVPWWDPGADTSVSPETDSVIIEGVAVSRGSRVLLEPRLQRADAQDMFLRGKIGMVEAVVFDVDDGTHLAVSLEDDPGADMMQVHGRFLYFAPDEVKPLVAAS